MNKDKKYLENPTFLKSLMEYMVEGIVVLDERLNVLGVNKGFTSLFGWGEADVVGLKAEQLPIIPAEFEKEVQSTIHKMISGEPITEIETKRQRKDQTLVDVAVTYNPVVDGSGLILGLTMVYRDITYRKKIEKQLTESDQRYKSLVEQNPDAIFSLNKDGTFSSINNQLVELVGYSRDELQQMTFEPLIAHDFMEKAQGYFFESLKGNATQHEMDVIHKSGKRIHLSVKSVPITVDDQIVGVYGVAKDITTEKVALKEVHRVKEELELIWNHIADAAFVISLEGEILDINKSFTNILGWSEKEIVGVPVPPIIPEHYKEDQKHLIERFKTGDVIYDYRHQRLKKDGTLIDVLASYSPIVNETGDVIATVGTYRDITEQLRLESKIKESEQKYRSLFENHPDAIFTYDLEGNFASGNKSVEKVTGYTMDELLGKSFVPLIVPEDKAKTLSRFHKAIEEESAESYEISIVHKQGHRVNLFVMSIPIIISEQVWGVYGIAKDITARRVKDKEIREVRKKFQLYWNSVSEAVFSIDHDGAVIDVNPAFTKMLGYTVDELRGIPVSPTFTGEMSSAQPRFLESFRKGEAILDFRTVRKTKDGDLRTVLASYNPVNQDDILAIGNYRDITEQVKVQEALQESEERYRSLFDYNKDAVWSLDLKGNFTSANPAFEKILGISPDIVTDLNLDDFEETVITSFSEILNNFEKVKQGKSVEYDLSMYRSDGEAVHLTITNVPIYVENQVSGVYGIGKDVTAEVNKENILRESERRYRLITDNMNDLIVMFDLDGMVTYASPSYEYVIGIEPNSYVGTSALSLIHEEDQANILSSFEEAKLENKTFTLESRIKQTVTGEWIFFETVCTPIFSKEGTLEGFVGVSRNITDRKAAEAEVQESQARYRLIADNSHDLILVMTPTLEVTYASPSFETVMGYAPEEVKETDLFRNIHPEDADQVIKKFSQLISAPDEAQNQVFRKRHRSGHWVWLETTATPILDENGMLEQFIVVARDVNEKKRYEQKLEHLAYHDPLTDLPNRRLFVELANQSLKDAERTKRKVGIMYLDLDGFKRINDSFGHDVGDELLIQFTSRMKENLRDMDVIARLGGDEFTILLPKTEKLYVNVIAKRILQAIQEPYEIAGHIFQTTSSIGIALYPEHGDRIEELLISADEAMYQAKEDGKNRIKLIE